MSFPELFAIAVALAMDAFAVSVCAGCALKRVTAVHFLRLSLTFGFFQFLYSALEPYWLAVALVTPFAVWIASKRRRGNMIRGGGDDSEDGESCSVDPTKGRKLLILAVATSIDALAVGLSFSLLNINVWGPSTLIGVVCAVITALGLLAGKGLAHADIFGRRAELVGGCVLIGIGLKILYEHGVLS